MNETNEYDAIKWFFIFLIIVAICLTVYYTHKSQPTDAFAQRLTAANSCVQQDELIQLFKKDTLK